MINPRKGAFSAPPVMLALVASLLLGACTPIYRDHGYLPGNEAIEQIRVGVTSRDEVAALLGKPAATGVLDDGAWIYQESRWRTVSFRAPELVSREVLAIGFDKGGTVRAIARLDAEDGRTLRLNRRVTEDNVAGVSFLRQLLGNVGNFSAADVIGD